MIKSTTYFLILFIMASSLLISQQEGEAKPGDVKPSEAKPLELPNYIIEGKGQINVQSGIKQTPEKLNKLTGLELDSINSLKKEQTVLLPTKPMPSSFLNITKKHGYFSGEFGSFITPCFSGSYEFDVKDYLFSLNGSFESSNGDAKNSDYIKANASIMAEYVAPEKFFVFGGSRTESIIEVNYNDFNLYAAPNPAGRNSFMTNLGVASYGNYSRSDFSTGASYKFLNLTTDGNAKADHALSAFLNINGKWNEKGVGASALVDFHSYDGNWMNFVQLSANGKIGIDKLNVGLTAGVQLANGTSDASLFDFLAIADLRYLLNQDFTLKSQLSHSMENNNMMKFYKINPYISDSAFVDFNRINQLKAILYYHPEDNLALSFGAKIALGTNTPVFVNSDTSTFKLLYKSTFLFSIFSEGFYSFSTADNITYNVRLVLNKAGSKEVTYDAPISLATAIQHFWIDDLSSNAGITYIGARFADIENTVELPSYFDLHFSTEYRFNKNWKMFIKINNILNQNIYIWNGYRERGLFLSGGINFTL